MKKRKESRLFWALLLTVSLLVSGCGLGTAENDYKTQIEELKEQNAKLQEQLDQLQKQGLTGEELPAVSENGAENHAVAQNGSVSESTVVPLTKEHQVDEKTGEVVKQTKEEEPKDDNITRIVVFGDSIWDTSRDETGIAYQLEQFMGNSIVYNCAIGGTRATIPDQDMTEGYTWASTSLGGMLNILRGTVDPSYLEGYVAESVIKQVDPEKVDYVIIAFGVNDYFAAAPLSGDRLYDYHTYAGALRSGIRDAMSVCPNAKILIVGPHYCRFFDKDGFMYADGNVRNTGYGTLSDYANTAQYVATSEKVLYIDAYNTLGINGYSAEEYLSDGVHLTPAGRTLYAKAVSSCLKYGKPGEVSGNSVVY